MTQRPRLSDRVVFTVDAPRAEFWRGRDLRRLERARVVAVRADADAARPRRRHVAVDPGDRTTSGAVAGRPMRQTFHVESRLLERRLRGAEPGRRSRPTGSLDERADGTVDACSAASASGATYTVTSRSVLRDRRRCCAPPTRSRFPPRCATSSRSRRDDDRTGRRRSRAQITAPAPTTYDKILALEAWLGAHVRYSINAPLAPHGCRRRRRLPVPLAASAGASRSRAASS